MGKRMLIIQGHPDASQQPLCHSLEDAYATVAMAGGHETLIGMAGNMDAETIRSLMKKLEILGEGGA